MTPTLLPSRSTPPPDRQCRPTVSATRAGRHIRRIHPLALGLLCSSLFAVSALADTVDARCDVFAAGSDKARLVMPCTFSQRQGAVGISRSDGVRHDLQPMGSPGQYRDAAGRTVYREAGLGQRGLIFRLPDETVYVYWDTAGLPQAGSAPTPQRVAATALPPPPAPQQPLDQQVGHASGIGWRLQSANAGSLNTLRLTLRRAGAVLARETLQVEGLITGAEVADLDQDGHPELYVFIQSAGSGSYGTLLARRVTPGGTPLPLTLPELTPQAQTGYGGHDQFAVVEQRLMRRFPIYRPGDIQAKPSGGVRQIQYQLITRGGLPALTVERVDEF